VSPSGASRARTSSGEDVRLASLAGPIKVSPVPYAVWQSFWYPEAGALFTFDLLTGTRLELKTLERNGQIVELRFERPGARVNRWVRQGATGRTT